VRLTVTSAFTVRDLHPIDCAHAGRTMLKRHPIRMPFYYMALMKLEVTIGVMKVMKFTPNVTKRAGFLLWC
ncbi:hypothetical protein, partial [Bhargavaea ginsengi]|uniref:hypothetical protein n=1 Tax=Bhargavaea ginsengi TaxID=426757 RepID=UPI003C73F18F